MEDPYLKRQLAYPQPLTQTSANNKRINEILNTLDGYLKHYWRVAVTVHKTH